jgi:hypothetical protein
MPNDVVPLAPTQHVDLISRAWSHLAEKIKTLQQQMDVIWIKEQEQPRDML